MSAPLVIIDQRLEALEAHVADQERVIAELNDVVTGQWRRIDKLERLVERLRETLLSLPAQREGPEQPPPHY